MAASDELIVKLSGQDSSLGSTVSTAKGHFDALTNAAHQVSTVLGAVGSAAQSGLGLISSLAGGAADAAAGLAHAVTGGFGLLSDLVGKAVDALGPFVEEAEASEQVTAQLGAVLKSTGGAAGVTAQAAQDLATSLSAAEGLSKFSDEAVLSAENLLLTFTNISSKTFPQASQAAVDMAAALGGAPKDQAIQLGKALNDPVEGISALTRVGVTFTDKQKEVVAALVKTGDMAGAQKIILDELAREFGGSAAASAKTFSGEVTTLKDKLGEAKETVGKALLPVLTQLVAFVNGHLMPGVQNAADSVATLIHGLSGVALWAGQVLAPVGTFIDTLRAMATGASFSAQQFQTMPGPLQDVARAFGGLLDIVDRVRQAFSVGGLSGALQAVQQLIPQIVAGLGSARGQIVSAVAGWATALVNWIGPAIPGVVQGLAGVADALFKGIVSYTVTLADQLLQWAGAFLDWLLPTIPGILAQLGQWATGVVNWVTDTAVPAAANALLQLGQTFINWIVPRIPGIILALGQVAAALGNWFLQTQVNIVTHLGEWGMALIGWIAPQIPGFLGQLSQWADAGIRWILTEGVPAFTTALIQMALSLVGWVQAAEPGTSTALNHYGTGVVGWITQYGPQLLTNIFVGWVPPLVQWVGRAITDVWPKLQEYGKRLAFFIEGAVPIIAADAMNLGIGLVNGIIRGLNQNAQGMLNGLSGLLNPAIDLMNSTFGTHLAHMNMQFRQMREIPMLAAPGFAALQLRADEAFTDMGDNMDAVTRRGRDFAVKLPQAVAPAATGLPGAMGPGLDALIQQIKDAFSSGINTAESAVPPLTSAGINAGNGLADGLGNGKGGKGGTKGAKQQTQEDIEAIKQTVINGLGQAAQQAGPSAAGIADSLHTLLGLAEASAKAHMTGIHDSIIGLLQQAANGTPPSLEQIRSTVVGQLQAAARDGDQATALLAQSFLDKLNQMEQAADTKSQAAATKLDANLSKAAQDAARQAEQIRQAVVQAASGLANEVGNGTQNIPQIIIQVMGLAKAAAQAGMGDLAGQMQNLGVLLQQGSSQALGQLVPQVQGALRQLVNSTDQETSLMAQAALTHFNQMADAAAQKTAQMANDATANLHRMAVGVAQGLAQAATAAAGGTQSVLQVLNGMYPLAQQAADAGMGGLANTITGWMQAAAAGTPPPLQDILDTVTSYLQDTAQSGDTQMALLARTTLEQLQTMASGATAPANSFKATVTGAVTAAHDAACGETTALKDCVTSNLNMATQHAKVATGQLAHQTRLDMSSMETQTNVILKNLSHTSGKQIDEWRDAILHGSGQVRDNLPPDMKEAGDGAVDGLVNALNDGQGPVSKAAEAIGNTVTRAFNHVLGMASPSKVMYEGGRNTWQGFINATDNMAAEVVASVAGVSEQIVGAAPGAEAGLGLAGGSSAGRGGAGTTITVNLSMMAPAGAAAKEWAAELADFLRIEMQRDFSLSVRT